MGTISQMGTFPRTLVKDRMRLLWMTVNRRGWPSLERRSGEDLKQKLVQERLESISATTTHSVHSSRGPKPNPTRRAKGDLGKKLLKLEGARLVEIQTQEVP